MDLRCFGVWFGMILFFLRGKLGIAGARAWFASLPYSDNLDNNYFRAENQAEMATLYNSIKIN
jgi:hypothetical protein